MNVGTRLALALSMTAYGRPLVTALAMISTISCQAELEQSPTEPYSTSLIVVKANYSQVPTVFLLVVDDNNSIEAAELRERVTQGVRGGLLHEYVEGRPECGPRDPARWQPTDMRIVVARPSAPDGEVLITPIDMPNLAWVTNNAIKGDIVPLGNATLEALGKRLALPGEPYRPLRAASRVVDLMMGQRPPMDVTEDELVASLPKEFRIRVLIASTREDQDNQPIEQLLPKMDFTDYVFPEYVVVGPSVESDSLCSVYPLGTSRLEKWSELQWAGFQAWPCANEEAWNGLLRLWWSCGCSPRCFGRPIAVSPQGVAACRIFVDQLDLSECAASNGWKDPDGQPQFVEHSWSMTRRCEIEQHTGTNLDACRYSYECSNCPSGFCVTEVPGIGFSGLECAGDDVPWSIRFTGGAIAGNPAFVTMMCDTQEN